MNEKTSNLLAHLLVIDDDSGIRSLLKKYLLENGYLVSVAESAIEAENLLLNINFDLIITDKMMPEKDGIEFVRDIRGLNNNTPVIMLTAVGDIDNKILGFENGVDDYISKPFEPRELLYRIASILKRNKINKIINFGDFNFDLSSEILRKNGKTVKLTSEQQKILNVFLKNLNVIITRESFAKMLDFTDERSVDVAIARLRKKIDTENEKHIVAIRNKGYKFLI